MRNKPDSYDDPVCFVTMKHKIQRHRNRFSDVCHNDIMNQYTLFCGIQFGTKWVFESKWRNLRQKQQQQPNLL